MNTSRLPEKCHTHLFLTLKEFAALGIHVLQWLQLFELMSKAQNHQIQSIKSFPKIKGKANIPVHAPRFAKSQYLQKDKQINNQKNLPKQILKIMSNAYGPRWKESVLMF